MKHVLPAGLAALFALGCLSPLEPIPLPTGSGSSGSATSGTASSGSGGAGGSAVSSTGMASSGSGGAGGGPACVTALDCPATGNECSSYVCLSGACELSLVPQGQPVSAQTGGDCKVVVCDGVGGVTMAPNDSDLPYDGNACTIDGCAAGQPTFTLEAAGTPCGVNLVCDGAGSCIGCLSDADCGPGTSCAPFQCQAGTCVTTFIPLGGGNFNQSAGDCKKLVCDGAGGTTTMPDDADLPNDGNLCTMDGCSAGQPTFAPVALGAVCGAGLVCDGAGSCVTCLSDAECSTDFPCTTAHCQAGTCAISYTPFGGASSYLQVPGDCKKIVCDGAGGATTILDDTDILSDGNPCTVDACVAGQPTFTVSVGAPCGPNAACDAGGSCVGCASDADCGSAVLCMTPHCQAGTCVPAFTPVGGVAQGQMQIAGDCMKLACDGVGGVVSIIDDTDVPNDGNPCTTDSCAQGMKVHSAASGVSCPQGVCYAGNCSFSCYINGAYYGPGQKNPANPCQQCSPAVTAFAWSPAGDGAACSDGDSCTADQCLAGVCVGAVLPNGTACDDGNPCTVGDQCQSGVCMGANAPSGVVCPSNSCSSGACNGSGSCVASPLPQGTLCPDAQIAQPGPPLITPGVCNAGSCYYGCFDGVSVWPPSTSFLDTAVCKYCNPSVSTALYAGGCHTNNVSGGCSHGICYFASPASCDPQCASCGVVACGSGGACYGFPLAAGTPCASDNNPCTMDQCNSGVCTHYNAPNGASCGPGMTCSAGMCQ